MTFERTRKWVTYGLIMVGLLPLALSGEIPPPAVLATYGGIIWSYFHPVPARRIDAHAGWWTAVTVVALGVLAALGLATGEWLIYAVLFTFVLIVIRLFQSRSARDAFQLFGLSSALLVFW